MKKSVFILTLVLVSLSMQAQPPKKKGSSKSDTTSPNIIQDTLQVSYDTTKYVFKVWQNGLGPESYLSRVPGYLVRKHRRGKFIGDQPIPYFFSSRWEAIKPEDIEVNLSTRANW